MTENTTVEIQALHREIVGICAATGIPPVETDKPLRLYPDPVAPPAPPTTPTSPLPPLRPWQRLIRRAKAVLADAFALNGAALGQVWRQRMIFALLGILFTVGVLLAGDPGAIQSAGSRSRIPAQNLPVQIPALLASALLLNRWLRSPFVSGRDMILPLFRLSDGIVAATLSLLYLLCYFLLSLSPLDNFIAYLFFFVKAIFTRGPFPGMTIYREDLPSSVVLAIWLEPVMHLAYFVPLIGLAPFILRNHGAGGAHVWPYWKQTPRILVALILMSAPFVLLNGVSASRIQTAIETNRGLAAIAAMIAVYYVQIVLGAAVIGAAYARTIARSRP